MARKRLTRQEANDVAAMYARKLDRLIRAGDRRRCGHASCEWPSGWLCEKCREWEEAKK